MRFGSTIERIEEGPRRGHFLVYTPYLASRPYVDPANPHALVCPLTGIGGTARTRIGARRLARRFERQVAQEAS